MKHGPKIVMFLIAFYMVAQVTGLYMLNQDIEVKQVDGKTVTEYSDTSLGPRPEMSTTGALFYLMIGVGIGTALLLMIVKLGKRKLWKFWFLLAAFLAMTLSLGTLMPAGIATGLAAGLALLKVFRSNVYIHNTTEILMYSGIAVFFAPMLDLKSAIILLIVFSLYDAYAVWKSKHMVAMAEFQADSNLFAGLSLSYSDDEKQEIKKEIEGKKVRVPESQEGGTRTAILGGGDIALPLLFTGAVMQWLVQEGLPKSLALYQSFIITVTSALALLYLFYSSEKNKFYPAMPFITVGCLVGLGIIFLL